MNDRNRVGAGRWFLQRLLFCSIFLLSSHAFAANGFALDRYTPTNPGEWAFWVDKPWYAAGPNFLALGLSVDYAHDPLVIRQRSVTGTLGASSPIVSTQLVGHFEAAASFKDRITASLNIPVLLVERGVERFGLTVPDRPTLSDPRIGAMVRLLGHSLTDAWSLHAGAHVWVPLGGNSLSNDNSVRVLPKLVLSGIFADHILYSVSAGFMARKKSTLSDLPPALGNTTGSEIHLGGSISWADLQRRFAIGPEVVYSTATTSGNAFNRYFSGVEILVGAHYNPAANFQTGLAIGKGLLKEPGTPDYRGLLRIAYIPNFTRAEVSPDRDHDGIADAIDTCPDVAGVVSLDAHQYGCPPDRDGDGVGDALDVCPDIPVGAQPDATRTGCPLVDSDLDGIFDKDDICPKDPAGSQPDPQRAGCPNPDRDADGVFDAQDLCPDVPKGLLPDPQRLGCPQADRDQDTVQDEVDACPHKGGMPSADPKKNGCPGEVKITGDQIVTSPVFFANGKAVILPKSFGTLQALADVLQSRPTITRVSIEGHTDNKGVPAKNLDLSRRRANSVMEYLVRAGIAAERLEAHGYGDAQPIADNNSAAGRAANRRVSFKILR